MESMLIITCMATLSSVDALKCFGATPRGDQLVECFPEATHCFMAYGVYKKSGRKATMKGCFDDRECTLENLWELFGADSQFVRSAKNDADWNQEPSCCNCAECNGPGQSFQCASSGQAAPVHASGMVLTVASGLWLSQRISDVILRRVLFASVVVGLAHLFCANKR